MRPSLSRRLGIGPAAVAVLAVAGCGSAVQQASTPAGARQAVEAASDPTQPQMVYFRITDAGYSAYDIPATLGRPVMLMLVNHGTRAHEVHANLPMTMLQIDNPYVTTQQPIVAASSLLDVTVPPTHEIDVIFTPVRAGTFPLADDTMAGGAFVVR